MIVVNFSHPLTPAQLSAIEALLQERIVQLVEVKTYFNEVEYAALYRTGARALVGSVGLTSAQWQQERLLINLPSLNVIAALVLAELHGRMGYFPSVIRLRPVPESMPPQFEVEEILNLHAVREKARLER
jgi:hypothetical protein